MKPSSPRARFARLAIPVVAAALALTACGGGGGSSDGKKADEPAKPQFWPLTGIQAPLGTSTTLDHPVVVVKMDNTEASAPQLGLDKADLIVEELVEGGLTRLAAFYYSEIPSVVGPVRSMRASDIGIVTPARADVVTSGAADVTIKRIKKAGITFFGEGAKGFFRDNRREAPYNLFTRLPQTVSLTKASGGAVPDYLPFGKAEDFVGVEPVTKIDVPFSWSHSTEWTYDGTHYLNTNSNAQKDEQFSPDSVLVLRVKIGDAGYKDPAGNPVPETQLVGTGKALLFHAGQVVRGTWTKSSLEAPFELATAAGPLTVPVGRTWIELVPEDGDAIGMKP